MKRFVVCLLVAAVLTIPWGFIPEVDANGFVYFENAYGGDEGCSPSHIGQMKEKIDLLLSTINQALNQII